MCVPSVASVCPPNDRETFESQQVASDCLWSDPANEAQVRGIGLGAKLRLLLGECKQDSSCPRRYLRLCVPEWVFALKKSGWKKTRLRCSRTRREPNGPLSRAGWLHGSRVNVLIAYTRATVAGVMKAVAFDGECTFVRDQFHSRLTDSVGKRGGRGLPPSGCALSRFVRSLSLPPMNSNETCIPTAVM